VETYLTAAFWKGALDRAIKSGAQALLLLWGADAGVHILHVDWTAALEVGAGAVVISLLTSLLSSTTGEKGTTSLIPGAK
jgi:hypothetical protein